MTIDAQLEQRGFAAIGFSFRGTIWENAKRFKLVGKAYEALPREQNGHFDISSARHLAGPLRALLDPNVRIVIIIGAVQVLKSVVGDIWIPYLLEHDLRNILVLFETDDKALIYCDARFMDTIKQHPELSKLLGEVNRHDVTKTEIKVAGAKLLVGGMNDSNVSSLSWPIIWVSEAWQHGSDGLLRKAIKRADRFPNDCKILIESQAGLAEEDLHVEARAAHAVPLTWACPLCGARQTFECGHEYGQLRPDDFPVAEKRGTYAGMKFAAEGTIDERARAAYWECFHCGGKIEDTRENRQRMMDSYGQDYQIAGPNGEKVSPRAVCFYLPRECARDNSFEGGVKTYLTAKNAQSQGNLQPLTDWYLQERAIFYNPHYAQSPVVTVIGGYDPNAVIENEHHRGMIIDCQKHLELDTVGTFWWETYAADKSGNSFQLERGFAMSWEELREIQAKWKIKNAFVCIDGRKWTPEILTQVATFRELATGLHPLTRKEIVFWSVWKVLMGDAPARHYRWHDGVYRVWSPPTPKREYVIDENKKSLCITVHMWRWSNISIKDQLNTLRIGGEGKPKFMAVKRETLSPKNQAKEVGDYTYDRQMSAEYRTESHGRAIWDKLPNRQNHYWDIACMRLVQLAMNNLAGHIAAPEETQK